jgi:type IV secretory pathway VirB10-like protein
VTDTYQDREAPDEPKRPPAEMRLRTTRPAVTRLSRKVLLGLGIVAAVGICGTLFVALQPNRERTGSELYNTTNRTTPGGLANLPRDYSGLPRVAPQLGPPLPGDLGRAILNAGVPPPGMPTPAAPADPQEQRLIQEREAARTSHLFAIPSTQQAQSTASAPPASSSTPADTGVADPATADHRIAFLNGNVDRHNVSPDRIDVPASPHVLQAGAVIAAALLTGLRSDLPGEVTAQVTEDIYDSPSGKILLIPQGARLLGQYDAQITFGQSRALLVWNRLIMPDGRSIVLERQPAADPRGYAGLQDEVDNHWPELFKAAILSTLLSVGSQVGTSGNENDLVQAIRRGASQGFNQVGQQVIGRSLNVQPTITIRPGFPVRVLVTRDLILEPYRR